MFTNFVPYDIVGWLLRVVVVSGGCGWLLSFCL